MRLSEEVKFEIKALWVEGHTCRWIDHQLGLYAGHSWHFLRSYLKSNPEDAKPYYPPRKRWKRAKAQATPLSKV